MDISTDIKNAVREHNRSACGGSFLKWWARFLAGLAGAGWAGVIFLSDIFAQHATGFFGNVEAIVGGVVAWKLLPKAIRQARAQVRGPRAPDADEAHQRGTRIVDATMAARVLHHGAGDLEIGGVPLPRNVEQQHVLLLGAPGSGKSVALKALLMAIRNRHSDGAVIHDPTGEMVAMLHDPSKDLIINPLDARHAPRSPWTDMQPGDEAMLSKALIPSADGDNKYFSDAAQATLEVLFQQTANVDDLVRAGLGESSTTLIERLEKAGLAGMVGNAKTFGSVRGNLAPYLKSLALLPPVPPGLDGVSLKDFCERPAGRFIFLLTSGRTRDALAPIHKLFLSQLVAVATSLRPDPARRVWLALDEVPVLLPSPTIGTVLSEGRKFGLSIMMAAQAIGQVKSRVGADEAAALLSMPKSRLLLRVGDGETAEALSREIGDRHIKRRQVSHTENSGGGGQGSSSSRGTSTTWQDQTERAVLPSQIMALPDLMGVLRVETSTMWVRLAYQSYPTIADDYQPIPPRPLPVPEEGEGE
ncbi:hypothetical protein C4901_07290 [Acidiferrobacter sp. SPIII_3]|uniref:type IV secretion system DNA-binding domain-containing protein n=1 Tax=Acidiferrobacter sp. SPIII_3 TaxID=1281578 RepID=UPI000D726AAB|nr:type IV secretion system DNA-binding domain-containing protein [Acidiferrobacter sp. SPIII_3]AWP23154.1 hypothetical protein C4901_07290 [Acidiferrobacter sp. SPIII_3]